VVTHRPPKQDKVRQQAINLFDQYQSAVRVHQLRALVGVVVLAVFSLIQYLCYRFYWQEVWSLVPMIGVIFGIWLTVTPLRMMLALMRGVRSEEMLNKVIEAGRTARRLRRECRKR